MGIVRRKPPREVLDRAHPIENKATGYWQCSFCLKADFRELSMVRGREGGREEGREGRGSGGGGGGGIK